MILFRFVRLKCTSIPSLKYRSILNLLSNFVTVFGGVAVSFIALSRSVAVPSQCDLSAIKYLSLPKKGCSSVSFGYPSRSDFRIASATMKSAFLIVSSFNDFHLLQIDFVQATFRIKKSELRADWHIVKSEVRLPPENRCDDFSSVVEREKNADGFLVSLRFHFKRSDKLSCFFHHPVVRCVDHHFSHLNQRKNFCLVVHCFLLSTSRKKKGFAAHIGRCVKINFLRRRATDSCRPYSCSTPA